MKLYEMEGFLRGKCVPGDMKVNETNAEYLVRKFTELEQKLADSQREFRAADATIENMQMQVEKLAAENAGLKNALEWLYEAVSMPDSGPIPDKYYSAVTNAAAVMHETPVTDAFLREVRAQGVDVYADSKYCQEESQSGAHEFAVELRQGGAA
ncbi:hypothetical protein SNQ60_002261 [Cronobacter turicensis]|nr:hypothetical protein [Cronobacter turicensis]